MVSVTLHSECVSSQTHQLLEILSKVVKPYDLVLAGGTALALHIGHRLSVDLDFFTRKSFATETLFQDMVKANLDPVVLLEEKDTLTVSTKGTKLSFFQYPYAFPEKKERWKGIPVAGVVDIAAMKLIAIAQRGAKRDFVDLYFILQDEPFWKIAENAVYRFGRNRINPVHIGKSLVFFADAEPDPEPEYVGEKRPQWSDIKDFFVTHVRQAVLDLEAAKRKEAL